MADATMSREEAAEILAAIKRLRDQLDIMQIYVACAAKSKTEGRTTQGAREQGTGLKWR
jgi:hypothetical protein